jgi:hypothetical protein
MAKDAGRTGQSEDRAAAVRIISRAAPGAAGGVRRGARAARAAFPTGARLI